MKCLNEKQNKIKRLAQIGVAVFVVLLFLFPWENISSASSVSKKINYQGRLKDGSGSDVADGVVSMVFKIYDSSESNVWTESWTNAALWTETSTTTFTRDCSTCGGSGFMKIDYATGTNESSLKAGQTLWNTTIGESSLIRSVSEASNYICAYNPKSTWTDGDDLTNRVYVKDGIFNVLLGSVSDMSVDFSGGEYLLGVQVGSASDTMDAEMSPRKPLSSVPQAINANNLAGDGIIDLDNTSTTSDGANINYNPASGNYSGLEITHGANGTGGALKVVQSGTGEIVGFYDGSTEVFKISDGGLVGIGTTSPSQLLSLQQAGTAKANTNMLSITNSGNASDMDGTISSILFNQYYYDASTPALADSGNISVGTETDWTSTATNQDAYMAFSTVLDGTMTEQMRITSAGYVGIGTTTPNNLLSVYDLIDFDNTDKNTKIGYQSGKYVVLGAGYNTYIGYQAGSADNATGKTDGADNNVGVGYRALYANTTGDSNVAVGTSTLIKNTTGKNNTAIGHGSFYNNTTGQNNVAIGFASLQKSTTGSNNTTIGYQALNWNDSAASSTAVGYRAGFGVSGTSNQNNSLFGYQAGYGLSSGSNNLLLGYQAGDALTTGSNNIVIGYDIDLPAVDSSNMLNIGNLIYATGMDGTGTTLSSGNVGIGTTSPTAYLNLKAGTATAGTAPLKFTAGTNLTTAEAGAMEWDGTNLYMTQTSGPTRKTIAYTDSAMTGTFDGIDLATGTQGGIPYFSSTTQLTSSVAGTTGQALISGGTGAPTWFAPTAGSVLFAGTSGILSQDNANFFWDDSNNRLGIGTTSPSTMLDIYGTSNKLRLSYDGSNYSSLSSSSSGVLEVTNSSVSDSAVIIGDGTSQVDISLQFDEVSQDYYFGVDNTDHYLKVGLGSVIGTSSVLTFNTSGLVGIGTTAPTYMLEVGTAANPGNVYIANGYICVDTNGTCAIASPAAGRVYAVSAYTTGADYAEYFYTKDTDLQPGEAVCVDVTEEKAVKRCENDGDNNVMGIVSTDPSIVGNHSEEQEQDPDHYKIIGMIGQVAGLVSAENGEIKIGDSLTASAIPGYMRKSNAGESTVGVAMENFKGTKGEIQILISRRNQSLTVEKVEEAVTENIKNMNVEDQVNNIVAQAKETLDSQIENTNQSLLDIQNSLTQTNSEVASIEALQIKIQQQMGLIEELATANSTFVASLFDEFGNLNLGEGKLFAKEVEVSGDVTAQNIEAADELKGGNLELGSDVSGVGRIEEGKLESDPILTKEVNEKVKIYITPIGSTKGKMLYYDKDDIVDGESFKVKMDGPSVDDYYIEFNWLIIK